MSIPFVEALVKSIKRIPYNNETINEIKSNRERLGGVLFFDSLVRDIAHIEEKHVYPPKTLDSLLSLIRQIDTKVTSNNANKAALIYYLFIDYPLSFTDNESLATYYADEVGISDGYKSLIHGFWCMDHLKFDEALNHLGHPQALPTYNDKIIETFVKTAGQLTLSSPDSTLVRSYLQILSYMNAKYPKLTSPDTVNYYLESLSTISIFSALRFIRTVSPDIQPNLFQQIIENTLTNPEPKLRKKNVWRLANLSLTEPETQVLTQTLHDLSQTSPDPTISSLSKDILLLRSLHTGDKTNTEPIAKLTNPTTTPSRVEWSDLIRGISLSS